jgi:hypothetical protein
MLLANPLGGFLTQETTIYAYDQGNYFGYYPGDSTTSTSPGPFFGEQVVVDAYAATADLLTSYGIASPISISVRGVVQYYAYRCAHGVCATNQFSFPTTVQNPITESCTSDTANLYAVQIAMKNMVVYAIGGTDGAFAGPGTVYWLDLAAQCWKTVGAAGTGPAGHAVALAADNGQYAYDGTPGPYDVWVTDDANNLYAACAGSSCAAPAF